MKKYRIVTRGEMASGFNQGEVSKRLAQLCQYDQDKLRQLFSGFPFTFKGNIDAATASRYKAALDKTGIVCEIEEDAPEERIELASADSGPVSHHPALPQDQSILCPKCGQKQPKGLTCAACGIVIDKFNQRQQPAAAAMPETESYRDEEPAPGAWPQMLLRLVALVVLMVGGYFGYNALFGESREVIVYTISDCEPCAEIIAYLQDEGLECTIYDIEESNDRTIEYVRKSAGKNQIPLAFIGDIRVDGINPALYQIAVAKYKGVLKSSEGATEVVMYSTETCGYCKRAARFFEENGIAYTEYDIGDPEYNDEYIEQGGIGTPLIFIGDEVRIDGFDQKALSLALKEAGLM